VTTKRGAGSSSRGARNTFIEDDVEDDNDNDDAGAPKKAAPAATTSQVWETTLGDSCAL
jgi:hypothetical protein